MKFIITGNHDQYKQCLHENNLEPNQTVYVSDRLKLLGFTVRKKDVIRYGTWYQRDDINEIEMELKMRQENE